MEIRDYSELTLDEINQQIEIQKVLLKKAEEKLKELVDKQGYFTKEDVLKLMGYVRPMDELRHRRDQLLQEIRVTNETQ